MSFEEWIDFQLFKDRLGHRHIAWNQGAVKWNVDVSSLEFGRARKVRNWWGFKRSPWTFLCISTLAAGIKESNETEVLAIRRAMQIGAATTLAPQIDWIFLDRYS